MKDYFINFIKDIQLALIRIKIGLIPVVNLGLSALLVSIFYLWNFLIISWFISWFFFFVISFLYTSLLSLSVIATDIGIWIRILSFVSHFVVFVSAKANIPSYLVVDLLSVLLDWSLEILECFIVLDWVSIRGSIVFLVMVGR